MTEDPGCVVVGAGQAGAHVVQTLREEGYGESITLVGRETERPYERPPLSKEYLQGKADASSLYVHEQGWYAAHDVDTAFGETVASIDRGGSRVLLASGDSVGYRHLVIATGSIPRTPDVPGTALAGARTLRSREQSDTIRSELATAGRVVVIGAGWIGLEVAAAARAAGREVTVLEYAQQPLRNALGEELGRYFADLHRANGVDVRVGVSVSEIVGSDGRVVGVRTDSGEFPADLVVMGVGARPDIALAADAGLTIESGGIAVDDRLRSSDPAILAAGDVATAFNTTLDGRVRVEHWDNATRQGRLAALSVLDRADRYDWQPYFFTDQFDLGMEYVGHGGPDDDLVVRGDQDSGEFIAFWLRDARVRAGMNVNVWDVNDDVRALLGRVIEPNRLADADVALSDL